MVKDINTTALAYIGDSVFEVHVRKHILDKGYAHADKLHKEAVRFVNAEDQSYGIKTILSQLSEKEQALVKKARNHKSSSRPKNVDPVSYKWATALEALIGYLYLNEDEKRLNEIIMKVIGAIEEKNHE